MFHLFGMILTGYGVAANNRGENEGNIARLQKLFWKGELHTFVSSEAIRWALRYYWQNTGYNVNRIWDDSANNYHWENSNFDPVKFIDDDVLGFFRAERAKVEASEQPASESEELENIEAAEQPTSETEEPKSVEAAEQMTSETEEPEKVEAAEQPKYQRKKRPKGTVIDRRGALEVNRAISTLPYSGDITFNAASGEKGRNSLYSTEFHATRYQYPIALTPDRLTDKSRVLAILDGLVSINEVGGNHARFLYDFSPESIVLRWTHDFCPRFFYCFEEDERGNLSVQELVRRMQVEDVNPKEFWVGGAISKALDDLGANVFPGVKTAVEALKKNIAKDL